MDWSALPGAGICVLPDLEPTDIAIALDDLPQSAPAVLLVRVDEISSPSQVVADLLTELEVTAHALYPTWLPGAEVSPGRGTIDRLAARSLAAELAAETTHYRPFLIDLTANAVAAQSGTRPHTLACHPRRPGSGNARRGPRIGRRATRGHVRRVRCRS